MWLTKEDFRIVIASTPLVSIDLVIQNDAGELLLGKRLNRPAKGYWFVPGGRILKYETLDDAFQRISLGELGRSFARRQAHFLGVYEHFYADSVFGAHGANPDTHYVVLGYHLVLSGHESLELSCSQHSHFGWWIISEIQDSPQVHENTRRYLSALR